MLFQGFKNFALAAATLCLSFQTFATNCPQALPASDIGFCASFQQVAQCHCQASGLPARMCNNVSMVYKRMISTFGSIERACQFQKDTTYGICIQDWRCYQEGGLTDEGQLCNATGLACQ
jgi:hypothetical protein